MVNENSYTKALMKYGLRLENMREEWNPTIPALSKVFALEFGREPLKSD